MKRATHLSWVLLEYPLATGAENANDEPN